ncbi:hypothetical protein [Chryseobacterium sp. 'Rf worker isolate 10']|uniref:hypothetical protein n=1 Tax=Chryseobacterium sp. 'Rf worker isolate 10' TaxID=2887348 RepID=UPI003D6E540A
MKTIIYENIEDFKENYFIDFSIQSECNMLQYLSMLKKRYNNHIDECRALHDKDDTTIFKILTLIDDLDDLLPYQSYHILKNDLLNDFNPMQYSDDDFIQFPEILNECIDLGKHSSKETKILYEKIKSLFTLKKEWSVKDGAFYQKADKYYEIVNYLTEQIEIEKNILLRSQNDNFSKQTQQHKSIDIDIQDIFNSIRYYDVGYFERTKILKDITDNYHSDLLHSLLKDLEFYIFIEREAKEAEFTTDEVIQAIQERQNKNLPIPRIDIDPKFLLLTQSPKEETKTIKTHTEAIEQADDEVNTKAESKNNKKDIICPDLEKLLFPYEFFPLYEFQRMIVQKIKEVSPDKIFENEIDISEFKTSKTKNIALLHHTGILQFLRDKFPRVTDNQLASFFELITKEPITARNQSNQFTSDTKALKFPIKNKQDKEELDLLLIRFGMKEVILKVSSEK